MSDLPTREWLLNGRKEVSPPATPPQESTPKYADNKRLLDDKKTALDLKELEIKEAELNKRLKELNAPSNSLDVYYLKLMEMQKQFNDTLLQLKEKDFETKLQLARLELGRDDETSKWMDFLENNDLIKGLLGRFVMGTPRQSPDDEPEYVHDDKGQLILNPKKYKRVDINNNVSAKSDTIPPVATPVASTPVDSLPGDQNYKKDLESYQQAVRDGKISLEQAWDDWKEMTQNLPLHLSYLKHMTFDQFKTNYDMVRAGGKI